jgi:hypothetical protein
MKWFFEAPEWIESEIHIIKEQANTNIIGGNGVGSRRIVSCRPCKLQYVKDTADRADNIRIYN